VKSLLITGSSGFVGQNLIKSLTGFIIKQYPLRAEENLDFKFDGIHAFIHLAGKAHDVKSTSFPENYYLINTEFTKKIFDSFLMSDAKVFITLSSVKAVADKVDGVLTEDDFPNPFTHYGKSKLLAENYIFSKQIPIGKWVYILRPCLIHGPGNKGNLNLLYKFVTKGIPWPLGSFENQRSLCSIDNLLFIIKELINCNDIPSGVYHVADDEALSTNSIISILTESEGRSPNILKISKGLILAVANLGDLFHLPINSERLQKLTESYVVSNKKIIEAIGKPLPLSSKEGLLKTFQSFKKKTN
jgi:nucleoside-diphosphate-sugar epimerase